MNSLPQQQLAPITAMDEQVLRMWLHGRQPNTVAAYGADVRRFLAHCGKPISAVTLADLQHWADSMAAVAQTTRARRLASAKSLLSFATRMGYIALDPGVALKVEKPQATAIERVLSEAEVAKLIAVETVARLRALLRLLYVCGLRASEAANLRWRDLTGNDRKGGEARILGKGAKLRTVVVTADLWRELAALPGAGIADAPVIPGRDGRPMNRQTVWRAVKRAARRARVNVDASTHWLRHSHGTHALDNGCKLQVLQGSMGHSSVATTGKYLHAKAGDGSASFIKG